MEVYENRLCITHGELAAGIMSPDLIKWYRRENKLEQLCRGGNGRALFIKGILCNVLVCGAVLLSYTSKDTIGKLVGAWLPIMLFVLIGYDHSIANMFYLTAAKLVDSSFEVSLIFYNLFYVTLGNIIGGMAIGLPLYFCYYKKQD